MLHEQAVALLTHAIQTGEATAFFAKIDRPIARGFENNGLARGVGRGNRQGNYAKGGQKQTRPSHHKKNLRRAR